MSLVDIKNKLQDEVDDLNIKYTILRYIKSKYILLNNIISLKTELSQMDDLTPEEYQMVISNYLDTLE